MASKSYPHDDGPIELEVLHDRVLQGPITPVALVRVPTYLLVGGAGARETLAGLASTVEIREAAGYVAWLISFFAR